MLGYSDQDLSSSLDRCLMLEEHNCHLTECSHFIPADIKSPEGAWL